uniref:Protein-lysine N-methyltransferase EFM4 n=1 Tax=Kwoniella bestiolae CBS 10118 TaxID=1296100 RepID=A0A1B9G9H3_9TREE|nr:hypothetical protein I302_02532 [Kwoniella bestiolae CBS 10118]OCF27688.1 hypothetical protein I302_02532 [Kwoniella bestiolae CBS 10118]
MAEEELPPSKLGTKTHWDEVYEREVRVFNDVGDEGEVWFGESSVIKMRKWAQRHLTPSTEPIRILECGSGNGTLLLSFLTSSSLEDDTPPVPQKFHLTGIDYSEGARELAQSITKSRRENIQQEIEDALEDDDEELVENEVEVDWRTEDLLRKDFEGEQWDLVLDKGTYDALCLSSEGIAEEQGRLPSQVYPERIARLVKKGGYFLITSCNFTEEEIKGRYTKEGLGFEFHSSGLIFESATMPSSSVPHPSFSFGGKSGTTVCTVAFKKVI